MTIVCKECGCEIDGNDTAKIVFERAYEGHVHISWKHCLAALKAKNEANSKFQQNVLEIVTAYQKYGDGSHELIKTIYDGEKSLRATPLKVQPDRHCDNCGLPFLKEDVVFTGPVVGAVYHDKIICIQRLLKRTHELAQERDDISANWAADVKREKKKYEELMADNKELQKVNWKLEEQLKIQPHALLPQFVKGAIYESKRHGPIEFIEIDNYMGQQTYHFYNEKVGHLYWLPNDLKNHLLGSFHKADLAAKALRSVYDEVWIERRPMELKDAGNILRAICALNPKYCPLCSGSKNGHG